MNFHVIFLATITAIAAAGAQSKVVPGVRNPGSTFVRAPPRLGVRVRVLDKPNATNSTILGTSMSAAVGWAKESPTPKEYLDGNSLKVAYYFNGDSINTAVKYTVDAGEFQDLIMWDQLSRSRSGCSGQHRLG
ncbi:Necrosis inducing protein [Phytophthora cactorum]|nr:Necrosis inducing protein [Phytophthora cactorum]